MTSHDVDELVRVVCGLGLPGVGTGVIDGPLDDATWISLRSRVTEQRAVGLLAAAVASGSLPVTHDQYATVAEAHATAMAEVLQLEAAALTFIERLADVAIEVRLLKGMATAHLDHADPAVRSFVDVDLLIRTDQFQAAIRACEDAGCRRDLPERRPGFDGRFAKDATLYTPDGLEIDLHRTLAKGPFGLCLDLAWLWSDQSSLELGGRTVPTLSAEGRFLNACYAAVLGDPSPRLVTLRDVAVLMHRPGIDLDAAIRAALASRGGLVLCRAVQLAIAAFSPGVDWPLASWAAGYTPSGWERRALRAYRGYGGTNTTTLLAGAAGLPTSRERAAYLRDLLLPTLEYRRARRQHSRPGEWRTGLRELLGPRGRR